MKSIVSYPDRGEGGNNSYRGNCSPRLIEDIIDQYKIRSLSDFMVGGGTTEDVCKRLGVSGTYHDLNRGFDMMSMDMPERAENIFWHPPYGGMIVYSDVMYSAADIEAKYGFDPRVGDLSRAKDWDDFVKKMNYCCLKQYSALDKGGRMFTLVGDWKRRGRLYSMLKDLTTPGTLEQVIIKAQHNCWSDRQQYSGNFVPIVHEYLLVLRKDSSVIIPVAYTKKTTMDVRDCVAATWRDVVMAVLEDAGRPMTLSDIYSAVDGHKKCGANKDWQAKIRQTLQLQPCFRHNERGVWSLATSAA